MFVRRVNSRWAIVSAAVGAVLVAASMVVPVVTGEDVRVHWPPLHADWDPTWTWRLVVVALIGLGMCLIVPRITRVVSWPMLLVATYAGTWVWTMALALSEGTSGLSRVYERKGEYVYDAKTIDDIGHMLHTFIDRIPRPLPDHWHTHVAGHPPGALLFYVYLDRLGITSPFWIGFVVVLIGSSTAVAVLVALRALGSVALARKAAPWLILAPTAIWMGVSGDAVYAAVAAWGLALLAIAASRSRSPARRWAPYAVAAGILLCLCIYLSYGLVLLAVLALAVLLIARSWRPIPWAVGGALAVVGVFTAAGFEWWRAYPVLVERYHYGMASERAYWYWVWADIAAWTFSVGLAVWAAIPTALRRVKSNPLAQLAAAAMATIVIATISGMSKAEVERIWLPFTFWILAIPAFLPRRWQRPLLVSQVVLALVVQTLLLTRW